MFDADAAGRIGREVLRSEELTKTFGERTLFNNLSFLIERGDRVGLVGPNGAGKTTLVKMILGMEQPTRGSVGLGHNARVSYFSQHAADSLRPDLSVIDSIHDIADMTETEARNYLARFLFTGDDVFKSVGMLSGGEKNKLALARMILEPCNLLILDEPTNHLDIASCEALTEMLSTLRRHPAAGLSRPLSAERHNDQDTGPDRERAAAHCSRATIPPGARPRKRPCPLRSKAHRAQSLASVPPRRCRREGQRRRSKAERQQRHRRSDAGHLQRPRPQQSPRPGPGARPDHRKRRQRTRRPHRRRRSPPRPPSETVADMVALAAEHTRLQDDLLAALAAWEPPSPNRKSWEYREGRRRGWG